MFAWLIQHWWHQKKKKEEAKSVQLAAKKLIITVLSDVIFDENYRCIVVSCCRNIFSEIPPQTSLSAVHWDDLPLKK